MEAFTLLPDPQTNGGLLVSAKQSAVEVITALLKKTGLENFVTPIGRIISQQEKIILIK